MAAAAEEEIDREKANPGSKNNGRVQSVRGSLRTQNLQHHDLLETSRLGVPSVGLCGVPMPQNGRDAVDWLWSGGGGGHNLWTHARHRHSASNSVSFRRLQPSRSTVKSLTLCILLTVTACTTKRGSGIAGIQPQHDQDRPGIEYRVVKIGGLEYIATRGRYWPGRVEKWDLVAVNR